MTDLLSRPPDSRTRGERPRRGGRSTSTAGRAVRQLLEQVVGPLLGRPPADGSERPLVLSAGLAGLAASLGSMVGCMVLALVGWYAADAGSHGSTTDALRVGADVWLVGHGSRLSLGGVPLGIVPLALTALLAWVALRAGRRAGRTSEPVADDRTLGLAVAVMTGLYLVVAVVTCVVVGTDAASPGLGRAIVGALLVAGLGGGLGLAQGSGRLPDLVDRVPGWVRAVVAGAGSTVRLLLLASLALVAGSLLLHAGDVGTLLGRLRLSTGDVVTYTVATVAVVPNAVLLGTSYLLGPGFAVGTGTVVSPGAVLLGPLPAFPLLAALPGTGPTPSWAVGVLAVPVLAAVLGAARSQRRYAVTAYDSAALRGFGSGFLAALVTTALVGLAGGPMGTGRLADVGAPLGSVLVAAVASMSLGGLVAGLVVAAWQRHRPAPRARSRRWLRSR